MAESCVIEVYENESYSRSKGWLPFSECPYTMKATMTPCKPIEEITVPSSEWAWSTNWKISKMPGVTDAEGWEYASRFSRFKAKKSFNPDYLSFAMPLSKFFKTWQSHNRSTNISVQIFADFSG
jgi:hypothetical protein